MRDHLKYFGIGAAILIVLIVTFILYEWLVGLIEVESPVLTALIAVIATLGVVAQVVKAKGKKPADWLVIGELAGWFIILVLFVYWISPF